MTPFVLDCPNPKFIPSEKRAWNLEFSSLQPSFINITIKNIWLMSLDVTIDDNVRRTGFCNMCTVDRFVIIVHIVKLSFQVSCSRLITLRKFSLQIYRIEAHTNFMMNWKLKKLGITLTLLVPDVQYIEKNNLLSMILIWFI